ncbi:hypothetical protein DQT32_03845 [Salmonella enterica subsp. enterica serovar Braenderup]|nr:hypothetical protein [Salmonella enterica subsp. enterica serovar Braenderup]
MSYKFKVNIGDWSDDGHGRNDVIVVESTEPNEKVQDAFKTAGKKIGVIEHDRFVIAEDYEDYRLREDHAEFLKDAGVEFEDILYNDGTDEEPDYMFEGGSEAMVHLVMRIAQTELDFEYKIVNDSIPNFNGYWGRNNISIGYGLFS